MRSIISGRAKRELQRLDKWWRENRDYKDVFIDEFEHTVMTIEDMPNIGRRYRTSRGNEVLCVLMPTTRFHIFYVIEGDVVKIASVWGAERGRGPKL